MGIRASNRPHIAPVEATRFDFSKSSCLKTYLRSRPFKIVDVWGLNGPEMTTGTPNRGSRVVGLEGLKRSGQISIYARGGLFHATSYRTSNRAGIPLGIMTPKKYEA
jgi:hypothetical protein